MTQYQWRDAFKAFYNVDAMAVGPVLEAIREEKGKLTARDVVDEARSKKSPLHKAFEWDNEVAAEQFRLEQARSMIRSIQIVTVKNEKQEGRPIFFHVPQNPVKDSYYQSGEILVESVEEWRRALAAAQTQLAGCAKLLREIEQLKPDTKGKRQLARAQKSVEEARAALSQVA